MPQSSYTCRETHFRSADGTHSIRALLYTPLCDIRGVVQIVHGMVEHVGAYNHLIDFLTENGFAVCGNDHLGHGGSVAATDEYGFFAEHDGVGFLIRDVRKMTSLARRYYPGQPLFLLGHSMGSMLARMYVVRCPLDIAGFICLGTTGSQPAVFGELLASLTAATRGSHCRSTFLTDIAFGNYCRRCDPEEGHKAWVSRDRDHVQAGYRDSSRNFTFTAAAYRDLFGLIEGISAEGWYARYPKDLPTLIASGEDDPVGNYGKGVREVAEKLERHGVHDLTYYIYPHMRHELHNDPDADIFFSDLLEWLELTLCPATTGEVSGGTAR